MFVGLNAICMLVSLNKFFYFSYEWAVVCECCSYFLHMLFVVCMVFIVMVVLYLLV